MKKVEYRGITLDPWYHLSITNLETIGMFSNMFKGWFSASQSEYNGFVKALLQGDVEVMNHYMNEVALSTFSYFDTGKNIQMSWHQSNFITALYWGLWWNNGRII